MSRHKLATLLILLSKWQQWRKPTRRAVMITTYLSRTMPPVKNVRRSCCCNSALIDHHALHWKVGGVFSGVMDGMTRLTRGGESCFNGKDNIFSIFSLIFNCPIPKFMRLPISSKTGPRNPKKNSSNRKTLVKAGSFRFHWLHCPRRDCRTYA